MTLLRLEILRLVRTRRWLLLVVAAGLVAIAVQPGERREL